MLPNKIVASYVVVNKIDVLIRRESELELKSEKLWGKCFNIHTILESSRMNMDCAIAIQQNTQIRLQKERAPRSCMKQNWQTEKSSRA